MTSRNPLVFPENSGMAFWRRPEFWFVLLALAGLLLRLEYLREFSLLPHFPFAIGPDVMEYDLRAREILNGFPFPQSPEIHAPLYSFFLALLYKLTDQSIPLVRAIQLLVNWAAWLFFARLLWKMRFSALFVGGFLTLAMLTTPVIFHQSELVSETLLIPLLTIFFYLMHGCRFRGRMAAAGAVLGFLVLTHGLMLCFAAAEILWALLRKKRRAFALMTAGFLLVTGSVCLVKSCHYGRFTGVQGNSAFNFFLGNNPEATGGCYLRPGRAWKEEHRYAADEAERRGISVTRLYLERVARFYRDDPSAFFRLTGKKLKRLLWPQESIAGADPERLIYLTTVQFWGGLLPGAILLFLLFGIVRVRRERDCRALHFLLLAFSLALGQLLTVTAGRYRMGMVPALLFLAAYGLEKFNWKRWFYLPLVFALIPLAVNQSGGGHEAEAASILGEARLHRGEWEIAEDLLRFAHREIDDPSRFCNMLAIIAENRGDRKQAEEYYREAMLNDPRQPEAWLNCGKLLLSDPARHGEAEALIRRSLACHPQQPEAWNLLGTILFQQRKFMQAQPCFDRAVELAPEQPGYRNNQQICRDFAAKKEKSK